MSAYRNLRINAKRLRVAQGLSQEALSERAKLGYKHYQKIESGNWGELYLGTVEAIAKALGVSASCLLEEAQRGQKATPNLPSGRPTRKL